MHILFTAAGGWGHVEPLMPLVRAAAALGHSVTFAVRPRMQASVARLGYGTVVAGTDRGLTPVRRELQALDMEGELRAVGTGFAGRIARERGADLLTIIRTRRPDLVIYEETDFGAQVAAEKMDIPCVRVIVIGAGGFIRPEYVAGPLDAVRAEQGLPPDPQLTARTRGGTLSPFPPGYRAPEDPLPANTRYVNNFGEPIPSAPPTWPGQFDAAPLIYFTLGTIFGVEAGNLYGRVLAGLHDLPVNVIATVGPDINPAELGPQPPHIRVEQFLPQREVLLHCDLVICHGGSGSVLGALAHGRPMVILPLGADQPLNAARCAELNLARTLDAFSATPAEISTAVAAVWREPRYGERARETAATIAAQPDARRVMEDLVMRGG
ncbi:MAG: glycosyltransferase [Caldilineaceae bacterium]|nr:glycosyltransferase [Caldilineaceae bacterium]